VEAAVAVAVAGVCFSEAVVAAAVDRRDPTMAECGDQVTVPDPAVVVEIVAGAAVTATVVA